MLGRAAQPLILQATGHAWLLEWLVMRHQMLPHAVHFVLVAVPQIAFPDGTELYLAAQFVLLCISIGCFL